MRIALIVAAAENGVIGQRGRLPWRQSTDLKRFRALTLGKPVVMGRRTFETLGRPLDGRDNIVVTRDSDFRPAGATTAPSLDEALAIAEECADMRAVDEIMVIGGGQIYAAALPLADRIYLTLVHARPEGDTLFPEFAALMRDVEQAQRMWRAIGREQLAQGPNDDYPATSITLARTEEV